MSSGSTKSSWTRSIDAQGVTVRVGAAGVRGEEAWPRPVVKLHEVPVLGGEVVAPSGGAASLEQRPRQRGSRVLKNVVQGPPVRASPVWIHASKRSWSSCARRSSIGMSLSEPSRRRWRDLSRRAAVTPRSVFAGAGGSGRERQIRQVLGIDEHDHALELLGFVFAAASYAHDLKLAVAHELHDGLAHERGEVDAVRRCAPARRRFSAVASCATRARSH